MGRTITRPTRSARPRTLRDLAYQLDVPYEKVRRLRMDGLQARPDGSFDVEEARRFQRERAARGQNWANQSETAFTWKERKLKAEALSREIQLQELLGHLVRKQHVLNEWRRCVVMAKNRLKALGRELAPRIAHKGPQECQALIDQRILEILRSLAHEQYNPNIIEEQAR